jgi:hypothetical protein
MYVKPLILIAMEALEVRAVRRYVNEIVPPATPEGSPVVMKDAPV